MNPTESIRKQLFTLADLPYREFNAALIPSVDKSTVIGVRTPHLRALAKSLAGTQVATAFLEDLPHRYFEENQLHAFLIETIREFAPCMERLECFLPYVDNWATCDQMCPSALKKDLTALSGQIETWMDAPHPYTVRYAIGLRMRFYLDDAFSPQFPKRIAGLDRKEYYVQMMQAWYFATAIAKQPGNILPYFVERKLSPEVERMATRKALESRRIPTEQKEDLRMLVHLRKNGTDATSF